MAAGALLIEEAGGMVGDPWGGDDYLHKGHIVAGNTRLFPEMLETLKSHLVGTAFRPGEPHGAGMKKIPSPARATGEVRHRE